mgnify:CR=1 FL=1
MSAQADELKTRTFRFALDVIQLVSQFRECDVSQVVRRQLTKSATSVGANYRAACSSRSHAEFTARIGIVAEEADETVYWLDIAAGSLLTTSPALPKMQDEGRELVAIFSRALGTARLNRRRSSA